MPTTQLIRAILQHGAASGSKSTAVQTIQWAVAILLAGVIGLVYVDAPDWLLYCVAAMLGIAVVLFVGAYIYFMRKDPDALRSERYALAKLKLEKGIIGDDIAGLVREEEMLTVRRLPSASAASSEQEPVA